MTKSIYHGLIIPAFNLADQTHAGFFSQSFLQIAQFFPYSKLFAQEKCGSGTVSFASLKK